MSRNQPVGIKRLTNICIVRLKRNGKRFEVAAYRNTVVAWRNKIEKDIDEVLQVHTIFANVDKGVLAKSEDMIEAFGTDDEDKVCIEVLNRGEFQVSEEERQMMVDALFRDIASRVTDMCVNPETQRPYPLTVIERAMRETLHFAPATNRAAKMQALQVIRQLEAANVMPIVRAKMQLKLLVPTERLGAVQLALKALGDDAAADHLQLSMPEAAVDATQTAIGCHSDPGLFRALSELAREHGGSVQVIELKARAEEAAATAATGAPAAEAISSAAPGVAPPPSRPPPPPPAVPAPPPAAPQAPSLRSATADRFSGDGSHRAAATCSSARSAASDRPKPSREERMFRLNLKNAEKGDPVAQLEVGKAYVDGIGVPVDLQQGRAWLEQAAQQGVNAALSRLESLKV